MEINRETLRRLAHLARLEFSEEEEAAMMESLSDILTWVEQLKELNTDGVEPLTSMSDETNNWRDDAVKPDITTEQALKNAPSKDNGFFIVPKVIE